ncbi:hypothetical protein JTE90_022321 [Oedothorax gibbosus]|uniref:Uncharacterized protein n=1 Tax=Oedothorax gibbosus TaxID=931172 RepID=A0AAV6VVS5_9ARAC|nr:hypothetical protein JTE90_022321 [Oedothorax gibbosus]
MISRSMLTLYTILIVVLVLILFLLVLSLILFRDTLLACCCTVGFWRRGQRPLIRGEDGGDPLDGLRNPGFDAQERPRRMPEQRPFDPMEQVESPPSYEEAVRQELFRFQPQHITTDRSPPSAGTSTITEEENHPQTNPSSDNTTSDHPDSSQSLPTTSCGQTSLMKVGRAVATPLSTIREEDHEEWPVTVVIDCIGVQAARLMENCETIVKLEDGSELRTHSKC